MPVPSWDAAAEAPPRIEASGLQSTWMLDVPTSPPVVQYEVPAPAPLQFGGFSSPPETVQLHSSQAPPLELHGATATPLILGDKPLPPPQRPQFEFSPPPPQFEFSPPPPQLEYASSQHFEHSTPTRSSPALGARQSFDDPSLEPSSSERNLNSRRRQNPFRETYEAEGVPERGVPPPLSWGGDPSPEALLHPERLEDLRASVELMLVAGVDAAECTAVMDRAAQIFVVNGLLWGPDAEVEIATRTDIKVATAWRTHTSTLGGLVGAVVGPEPFFGTRAHAEAFVAAYHDWCMLKASQALSPKKTSQAVCCWINHACGGAGPLARSLAGNLHIADEDELAGGRPTSLLPRPDGEDVVARAAGAMAGYVLFPLTLAFGGSEGVVQAWRVAEGHEDFVVGRPPLDFAFFQQLGRDCASAVARHRAVRARMAMERLLQGRVSNGPLFSVAP